MLATFSSGLNRFPLCRWGMVAAVVVAAGTFGQSAAWSQKSKKQLTTIQGTVVSVEKKGRTVLLTVETEDNGTKEKKEFKITRRVQVAVTAKGDDGFLAPRQFITTSALLTNNRLFAKKYTVHLGKGKKPRAGIVKAPKKIGQSVNTYLIAGTIVSRQQDQDYKEYETVTLAVGGARGAPVFLDKGFSVTVSSNDLTLATAGSPIELEGRRRGSRFNLMKATVKLAKPLKSEEYFANADKRQ